MNWYAIRQAVLAVLITVSGACPLAGGADDERDWPCEQALVPEIDAAVVWDGPDISGLSGQWAKDPQIATAVRRLTARRYERETAEAVVEAFSATQPASEGRDRQLSQLFAGVLEVMNDDRRRLIDGILRYARDQQRRAEVLGTHLAEIAELESDPSDAARTRLHDLQQQVTLEQRMFDDREHALPFLCTRPREVEQRVGELARMIAMHLQ
ncbi:MAG: hypothetical protein H6953_03465 [Chromatiaceae bacterium]|nr:hypothetical protein [Chromatiaceae bacterium]MCP5314211.1 hypothetical protein [Chromatiaceae bacterium]